MVSAPSIVTSRSNQRVKQLRAALAGNTRLSGGLLGMEGEHLIAEALRSGIALHTVFLAEGSTPPSELPATVEIVHLSREVFASAVATESPQGIAALLAPPQLAIKLGVAPLLLVAVGLQDPGNLGTLIRSAEAFGAAGIILTPGTVSPWNQKALRASAGSTLRLPVESRSLEEIAAFRQQGIRLIAATAAAGQSPGQIDLKTGCALMIGNEGAGLGPEWLAIAEERITLSCPGPVESLNAAVAGSLLLYEASRQRANAKGKP